MASVIFTNGGGRLSNQLLNYAHLYSWALEKQLPLLNIAFWAYSGSYETFGNNRVCAKDFSAHPLMGLLLKLHTLSQKLSPDNKRRLQKVIAFYLRRKSSKKTGWHHIQTEDYTSPGAALKGLDLCDDELNRNLSGYHTVVLSGWSIRGWQYVEKHQEAIQQLFQPAAALKAPGDELLQSIRKEYDKVVGVFIRQGDYATWMDGRYFYSVEQYGEWMQQVRSHYAGEKTAFLVTCEVVLEPEKLVDGNGVFFSNGSANLQGSPVQAHYELSQCDVIMSPPSTFAAWAGFMGNTPLLPLCGDTPDCLHLIHGLTEASEHVCFKDAVK